MGSLKTAALLLALTCASSGQSVPSPVATDSSSRLPVTRVILYKNGIGYFEHSGRVRGSQNVNIDFTTAQLNDVLKSLTVLDLGKGRITGVSYNSTAPIQHQLGLLRLPVGENPTTAQFLTALRGARVEIRSGSAVAAGRLLSIEERDLPPKSEPGKNGDDEQSPGGKLKKTQIAIVSDGGELRVFELAPSTSVRVMEKDVNEEVGKYLGLIASTRDQDVRRMAISTTGDGERNLLVSYISEVPVWKSTYRIVVPNEGKPLLQGWAIVDNTVGEDWKDVELSLIAGSPQSFIQELSQPYYSRRPVVPLPENAMLTPQTHEATLEEQTLIVNGQLATPGNRALGVVGGVPGGVPGGQMGGVIGGVAAGSAGGVGASAFRAGLPAPPPPPHPDATEVAESLEQETAVGQSAELGDLFEYKLKDRVTIHKNQSALVPILQARIEAEKVSVWNPSQESVLRGLWITNSSNLTLDGGTFNVLEGDAFAGEGLMDPIKPGEKRLLSYAADLGLLVDAKQKAENQHVSKISIAHGAMIQSTEERQEETYTIRNRDTSSRVLIVEHPARQGWKLTDSEIPAESSSSYHRFRIAVEPNKTTVFSVKEYRPVANRWMLTSVTDEEIKFFLDQRMINSEVEKALRSIVAQKNNVAVLDAVIGGRRSQVNTISEDQQRVRENMKALKGSTEEKALLQRYVSELNEQEDRVQALRKEISEMQQKRDAAQSSLNTMIENLQMDAAL